MVLPAGKGPASRPYRVLLAVRTDTPSDDPHEAAGRESCRPQGVRRTPEARYSVVKDIKAVGDAVTITEAETEESSGRDSGEAAGVRRAWHV